MHCLATVTAQRYERLTILVSDNCSLDETRDVVLSNPDKRIRYIRTTERLGMSEHWEWALAHVCPGWLGIIGDDDGLAADCLERVSQWMSVPEIDSIKTACASFVWPSSIGHGESGRLMAQRRRTEGAQIFRPGQVIQQALEGRAPFHRLPLLYTGGWVRTECIDAARDGAGRFFRGPIPDVYSAVALAMTTRRAAYLDRVLAINGTSRHSNGAAHLASCLPEGREKVERFWTESRIEFHKDVPRLRNGELSVNPYSFYLESLLQAHHLHPKAGSQWREHVQRAVLAFLTSPGANKCSLERQWLQDLAVAHNVELATSWRWASRRRIAHLTSLANLKEKFAEWSGCEVTESPELTDVRAAARFLGQTSGREPSAFTRIERVFSCTLRALKSNTASLSRRYGVGLANRA